MPNSSPSVDPGFYCRHYADLLGPLDPEDHYIRFGRSLGLMPNETYDPLLAAMIYPLLDEAERVAALSEAGLPHHLKAIAQAIFRHIESPDAFFWRFGDTQVHRDPTARRAATIDRWDEIDRPGATEFKHDGKTFTIVRRSPEEVAGLIRSGEPCVHARLPHGFVDTMARLGQMTRILIEKCGYNLASSAALRIAIRVFRQIDPKQPTFAENFIHELLDMLEPGRLRGSVSLAFKAHPDVPDLLFGTAEPTSARYDASMKFISENFPSGYTFEDGIGWKRFVSTGRIGVVIEALRERTVLLIANAGFKDLGRRWGLPAFHHLEIPPEHSHAVRHEILARARSRLTEISRLGSGLPPVVLTQIGGSFSLWLLPRLAESHPESAYIDVGQALNPWFLDDAKTSNPDMLWLQDFWAEIFGANDLDAFYRDIVGIPDSRAHFSSLYFDGSYFDRLPKYGATIDLASFLLRIGLDDRALHFAERANALDPNTVPILVLLATLYRRLERVQEAGRAVDRILAIDSGHVRARQLKAALLFEAGNHEAFLELAMSLDAAGESAPLLRMSIASEALGRIDAAIDQLSRAISAGALGEPFHTRLNALRRRAEEGRRGEAAMMSGRPPSGAREGRP